MTKPGRFTFKSRFLKSAFGWNGSRLACQQITQAISEICKAARKDPLPAAEGAIKYKQTRQNDKKQRVADLA